MNAASKKDSVGGSWAYGAGDPHNRKRDPAREVVAKPQGPGATGFDVYAKGKRFVGHKENIEDARELQRQGETGRYLVRSSDGVLLGKPTTSYDPGSYFDEKIRDDVPLDLKEKKTP
jgi:hypothetical protein